MPMYATALVFDLTSTTSDIFQQVLCRSCAPLRDSLPSEFQQLGRWTTAGEAKVVKRAKYLKSQKMRERVLQLARASGGPNSFGLLKWCRSRSRRRSRSSDRNDIPHLASPTSTTLSSSCSSCFCSSCSTPTSPPSRRSSFKTHSHNLTSYFFQF